MPKIQVNEKDMSWYYRTRDPGVLTVLMPIVSTWGPYEPTLVDAFNFETTYGNGVVSIEDISYPMAASLVKNGVTVLGLRVNLGGKKAQYPAADAVDDPTLPPITIKANYPGSWANTLKVTTSERSFKIVDASDPSAVVAYDVITADSQTSNWNTTKKVLYVGEETEESPLIPNSIYQFSDDAWIVVNTVKLGSYSLKVSVTNTKTKGVVETVTYELVNNSSGSYYETINEIASDYIDIDVISERLTPAGAIAVTTDIDALLVGGDNLDDTTYPSGFNRDTIIENLPTILNNDVLELRDPLMYDFDVVIDGGYNHVSDSDSSTNGVQLATKPTNVDIMWMKLVKAKGTAVYLVDGDSRMDDQQFYSYCGKFTPDETEQVDYAGASSYCAAYGPWCYAQLLATGEYRELPGSYVMLTAWARAIANGAPAYLAPAGVKRASLGTIVMRTLYPVGSAIIDAWQNHEYSNVNENYKVNPIARLKQFGPVIYGNSTLLKVDPNSASSVLQSFSTRVLINMIKKRAFDISLTLQFDQIDADIFAEFRTVMGTFMDELRYGGALYDYRIVGDYSDMTFDSRNQRTIPVKILISPNLAVENFIIDLEIHPSGVTFGDDTSANLDLPLANLV